MSARSRKAAEREFLPAVVAAQESPPSPLGRALLLLILLFFVLGILWSSVGEVDIVVTAPGHVVPLGQAKVVQAFDHGEVEAVLVRDGQRVAAGEALVLIDSTEADAESLRIRNRLAELAMHIGWRRELALWLAHDKVRTAALESPLTGSALGNGRALALYAYQRAEVSALLGNLAQQRRAAAAEQAMARGEREKAAATLAILDERVGAHEALLKQQYGARVQYLELLQAQAALAGSLPVLAARERQLEATAAALEARSVAALEEQRKNNLLALAELESEQSALAQELRKVGQRRRQQVITAPVTGTVQELALHTVGGVVSPAQPLLKIVPADTAVEVEALLRNRDVGFVHEGQRAAIKVDTFNFTRYGLLDAEVIDISDDALEDPDLGRVFKLRLSLHYDRIAIDGKWVRLSPGMAVTAELRTGKRRLIEYFLSPLLRYRHDSVRER